MINEKGRQTQSQNEQKISLTPNLGSVNCVTMTSREIAEIAGKRHDHVLKSIRNMEPAWEKVTGLKFQPSEFEDSTGRKLPMFELTRRECLYVATKYNDEARARLIVRWEDLECQNLKTKTKQLAETTSRLRPELTIPDDLPDFPRSHVFTTDYIEVCDRAIRRVTINDQFYYCLVDIQVAAGMNAKNRGQLEREVRKAYSFKISTKNNSKLADYLNAEGIQILCSRSHLPSATQFLVEFNKLVTPFNFIVRDYKKFDYGRFLEIIVKTKDDSDRMFLYELYKTLGGVL